MTPRSAGRAGARSSVRGIAAIELALVLTIMLTLVFGVVDIGRALYAYDTMAKSARAAARFLSADDPADTTRQTQARCIAIYGSPTCGGTPLAEGLDSGDVTVSFLYPAANPGVDNIESGFGGVDLVTVSISGYRFSAIVSAAIPDLVLGPVSVTVPYVFF